MTGRRTNKGWFKQGPDARRHPLTDAERSRGGRTTFNKLMVLRPEWLSWLTWKIRQTARSETLTAFRRKRTV